MNPPPFEFGKTFHIYNFGNNREILFRDKRDYSFFINLLEKYLPPTCCIYAFVLLPYYFHLLIHFKNKAETPYFYRTGKFKIQRPFVQIFTSYAMNYNRWYNRSGSLFQEHLPRTPIINDVQFRKVLINIHLAPFVYNTKENIETYPYSSYQHYINENETSLLNKSYTTLLFSDMENLIKSHKLSQALLYDEFLVYE